MFSYSVHIPILNFRLMTFYGFQDVDDVTFIFAFGQSQKRNILEVAIIRRLDDTLSSGQSIKLDL